HRIDGVPDRRPRRRVFSCSASVTTRRQTPEWRQSRALISQVLYSLPRGGYLGGFRRPVRVLDRLRSVASYPNFPSAAANEARAGPSPGGDGGRVHARTDAPRFRRRRASGADGLEAVQLAEGEILGLDA